jgi:type IV pilus assembly protein PilM
MLAATPGDPVWVSSHLAPKPMAFFKRRKVTIGLDIGSGLVKVAVIDHGKGLPELQRVVVEPVPVDAIVEGEVMDHALVIQAVQNALAAASAETKGAHIVAAVGGGNVIVRKVLLDRAKMSELRDAMQWEAEQIVPFDTSSILLDYQVLDPDGESPEMSVLLAVAKRDLIDARVQLLRDAGVEPRVVDVEAFALHNAFEFNHPDAMRGTVALVNIGNDVCNVSVLDDGIPILTRDYTVGVRRLREDLQRDARMTVDEADSALVAATTTPALDTVVHRRGEELAKEIERTGTKAQSLSRTMRPIREVYIAGGGARVTGLAERLASLLRIPVRPINPLLNLAVADGALADVNADEVASLLVLPVGLALRQVA